MPSFIYKGYVLRYCLSGHRWRGTITRQGGTNGSSNPEEITAAVEDGEDAFCARAKGRIDEAIAAKGK